MASPILPVSQLMNSATFDAKTLRFPQAADSWMETKRQEVGEGTARYYAAILRQLKAFFGQLKLSEIQREHITEYRRLRQVPHEYDGRTYTAGALTINHEISALSQILDRAGLWAPLARNYKPMRRPRKGPGQRLELEELRHLLKVAEQSSRWKIAYLCSIVSANTAGGPGEILNLRLKDLDFKDRTLTFVQGTKLDGDRIRTIPMTDDCYRALEELAKLAREKGSVLPDHYLLPKRAHVLGADPDPTKHMGSYRKAWEVLRKEAAKKFPRLLHVRRYDLRHTALTMMAEDPNIDAPTLHKIAGWGPGSRMLEKHYFHESMKRKRVAVSALDGLCNDAPSAPQPAPVSNLGTLCFWSSTNFRNG